MSDALIQSMPDLAARRRALDPHTSFIVQAPAGSGKTELLIQRALVLLARVERPEEVIAMTFTRKAAAEMQKRLTDTLDAARHSPRPETPHKAVTWDLARAVVERDAAKHWHLESSPGRLRIQTIDSLCAFLAAQLPVSSRFGAPPEPVEDASERERLYAEAARNTLARLESADDPAAADVARLLVHLDNNTATAVSLLVRMLETRDHWLRHLHEARDRHLLEQSLQDLRLAAFGRVSQLYPAGSRDEMIRIACYAAANLAESDSAIAACLDLGAFPSSLSESVWLGIAAVLLKADDDWREKVDRRQGFPPGEGKSGKEVAKHWKERLGRLIESLKDVSGLRESLAELRLLPMARYSDDQWDALDAITRLLPRAVGELKLVFGATGRADFVEIAQGALVALGSEDEPTDLMLSLDYRVRHLLVDEFQDTSFTQYDLLKRLTAGWQADDGRTLFVVGDPMQSIYRFRQAEVGLFLKARQEGIGSVLLEPLTLSTNFRSQAGIVDWVNTAFPQVLPAVENVAEGAVPYSPSDAVHPAKAGAVTVHAHFEGDVDAEAAQLAQLVRNAQAEDPAGSIAVLVRTRSHLKAIVPALKTAGLAFRAIEIEPLGHRQAVQDLLGLTRALAHLADRPAWLAVLRAPWCGLTLADLHALCGVDRHASGDTGLNSEMPVEAVEAMGTGISGPSTQWTVWECMLDEARLAAISADGRARLERTRGVLGICLAQRFRTSLREAVEGAWLALGGPACADAGELEDAGVYFDHLEAAERSGGLPDAEAFEQGLSNLYAQPDLSAGDQLQIMTMHKAKGLEFDTVIVPGLGHGTRSDERQLFIWLERAAPHDAHGQDSSLLLAPINPSGSESDPIYEYIRRLDRDKASLETGRLLYVAATRARRHLHLLGDVALKSGEEGSKLKPPVRGSLLAKLWPAVETKFEEAAVQFGQNPAGVPAAPAGARSPEPVIDQLLRRLPSGWHLPAVPAASSWPLREAAAASGDIEFSWAGETARHVGSVVHRWLQNIAEDEMKGWDRTRIEGLRPAFRNELAAQGVEESGLATAAGRVAAALTNSLEDERGRWLLGPQRDARNEYRITAVLDGVQRHLVIDRLFTDAEGRRRIIDYKTGGHEGADVEAHLDREQARYRAQLERYTAALGGGQPGLYFPLLSGWREWPSGSDGT